MPDLGAVDPADLRAQARAELGLSRQLAQSWRVAPHPRGGGSSDYPVWSCEEQLEKWGEETVASEASLIVGPSASSHIVAPAIVHERRLLVLTLLISWYCSSPIPTLISMRWQPTFTMRGGGCTQVNKSPSASRSWISRRRLLQSRPIRPRQRRCSIASSASGTKLPPLASFRCPGGCSLMLTSLG